MLEYHVILNVNHDGNTECVDGRISVNHHELELKLLDGVRTSTTPPIVVLHEIFLSSIEYLGGRYVPRKDDLLNRGVNKQLLLRVRERHSLPHSSCGIRYSIQVIWEDNRS